VLESLFAALLLASAVALALWGDLRLRGSVPGRTLAIGLHLGAATLAVVLAAEAMNAVASPGLLAVASVLAVFLPALVYLFLSAIWMARVIQRVILDA
jgi:hypothetical protein